MLNACVPASLQLFINGEYDDMCPAGELKALAQEVAARENPAEVVDMRAVVLPVRSGPALLLCVAP